MISPADRSRRPRRFFGLRGVVRRPRRPGAGGAVRPRPQPSIDADRDRALQSERARFAAGLDLELRLASRSEAAMRRELGDAARAFLRARAYRRLWFVRLSDYARERLGVSARTLQSAAWLATRLDALPAVSTAYDRSELSWAAARAICKVAVAADEEEWLAIARRSTVETLERLVARARQPDGIPADPDGDPNEIDSEPAIRWRFVCPARVRALWRRALELASRAAEGSSGRPRGTSMGDRGLLEALRLARRARRREAGSPEHAQNAVPLDERPTVDAANGTTPGSSAAEATASSGDGTFALIGDEPPAPSDPFALDARLTEAMRVLRTIEPRIGRSLRVVVDQRIYRSFGYPAFDDYVRERLGIAVRKAWALLKIEKATLRSADFDRAYRDGRLSWACALSLLPVLDRTTAPAWMARAESVTVRRLCDEVEWVLASRDALGSHVSLAPPPVDSRLPSPIPVTPPDQCRDLSPHARLQIRAHEDRVATAAAAERQKMLESTALRSAAFGSAALEIADAEIRFTPPPIRGRSTLPLERCPQRPSREAGLRR